MRKIIATIGLPASGKSTWARQFQRDNRGWVRISDADISYQLSGRDNDADVRPLVRRRRKELIRQALDAGRCVILDNTHLSASTRERLEKFAAEVDAELEWRDFRDVSVSECIRRDARRDRRVGARVIEEMARGMS